MRTLTAPGNLQTRNDGMILCLTVLMFVRICSYFMLSESVAVTQLLKIGFRIADTGISFLILRHLFRKTRSLSFSYPFPLAIVLYLAYLLLGMFSLLWTSRLSDSTLQLLMDAECLAFCFFYISIISAYNAVHEKQIRLSNILSVSIVVILIGFISGMYINPEKFYRLTHGGEVARLGGFIINPNELGMLIVTGFAMCCVEMNQVRKKGWVLLMMGILAYALILTGSRSSMIGMFLILLYFIKKSGNLRLQFAVIICMIASLPFIINQVFIKAGDTDEVLNMTGRIPFWRDLLTINFPKEPLLGFGFMRIDYQDRFESLNSYAGEMTHNTFIQVLMNLGLVGLFIVILQLAFTIHAIFAHSNRPQQALAIGLLIPALINSFTEFGIFGETNYGIMFYLFIVFMQSMEVNHSTSLPYKRVRHDTAEEHIIFRPDSSPGLILRGRG